VIFDSNVLRSKTRSYQPQGYKTPRDCSVSLRIRLARSANGVAHLFIGDSRDLAVESLSLRTRRLSEFIRVRKDEWEGLRRDIEMFVQNFEASRQKLRDLMKENNSLKEQLQSATQRLATTEQKATADLQQTSQAIQKMRSNISRVLQQTEKEM